MSHIAVVIYILEILLGLLHWTEAVTDALAICPAAKPDAQQPAVPASAKHPSPHITEPPRDAAASWGLRGAQGPSAPSKDSALRQHFRHQPPPAWRWDTQKGPSKEGRKEGVGKGRCWWVCTQALWWAQPQPLAGGKGRASSQVPWEAKSK